MITYLLPELKLGILIALGVFLELLDTGFLLRELLMVGSFLLDEAAERGGRYGEFGRCHSEISSEATRVRIIQR